MLICLECTILVVLSNMSFATISSFIPIVLLVVMINIVMVFVIRAKVKVVLAWS